MYKILIFIFSGILFIGCSQKVTTQTTGWQYNTHAKSFEVIHTPEQKEKLEKKEAKAAKKKAKKDKKKLNSKTSSWEYYNPNATSWEYYNTNAEWKYTTPCSDCPEIVIK